MAAAAPAAAGGAGEAPERKNISTIKPPLRVSIGVNKNSPIYALGLFGTGFEPKSTYDLYIKLLPKQIDSNKEMCVGLTKAFTKRSAENCNLLFVVEGDIYKFATYGFATVMVHKLGADQKKYFEIDAFCTKQSFKGVGRLIMNEIKKVASEPRNAITSIVLKSTPGAIPFYLSQGFRMYDAAPNADKLTRMYFNLDGSDDNSWTIIPQFRGDPIVPPAAPAAAPASAVSTSKNGAGAPVKSSGGRSGTKTKTKRRSKGSNKKKYTRK